MIISSKAPPVYRAVAEKAATPPEPPRLPHNAQIQPKSVSAPVAKPQTAPPVYRPQFGLTAQPKARGSFRIETRPAPPVFRPQSKAPVMRSTPAPGAPPVYRPVSPRPATLPPRYGVSFTLQRMESASAAESPSLGVVAMEIAEVSGSVEVEKSGDVVPAGKLAAIKLLIAAAVKGKGARRSNDDLVILERILAEEAVRAAKPKNSEGTFAIGKQNKVIISTGSGKFEEEVVDNTPIAYSVRKLGNREDFIHGESTIVKEAGGAVSAVAATQDCCLFCYGYLESQAIGHQGLRDSPFPKGWIHPAGTFTLKQVNPNTGPKGPLVWITFNDSTRLYRVD